MNDKRVFWGLLVLSAALLVSALILANALRQQSTLNGNLNGNLSGNLSGTMMLSDEQNSSKVLFEYDVAVMLGYDSYNGTSIGQLLQQDIRDGKLAGIPYTYIDNKMVFSRKALEEWLFSRCQTQSADS